MALPGLHPTDVSNTDGRQAASQQAQDRRLGTLERRVTTVAATPRAAIGQFVFPGAGGNLAITGTGFKPIFVKFSVRWNLSWFDADAPIIVANGWASATQQYAEFSSFQPSAPTEVTSDFTAAYCIYVANRNNASVGRATLSTLDTNGFTINVSNAWNQLRVYWEAYG